MHSLCSSRNSFLLGVTLLLASVLTLGASAQERKEEPFHDTASLIKAAAQQLRRPKHVVKNGISRVDPVTTQVRYFTGLNHVLQIRVAVPDAEMQFIARYESIQSFFKRIISPDGDGSG